MRALNFHRRCSILIGKLRLYKKVAVGGILNIILFLLFAFSPRLYRRPTDLTKIKPKRILVCRPDHIGDAILSTPVLRGLRASYPDADITFAVASWSAPLFLHNAHVTRIMVVDPPWWIRKRAGSLAPAAAIRLWLLFARNIIAIRRVRYDLCIELRGDVRQILAFGFLGGARHLITFRRNGGHFIADKWLPINELRHEALQNCDLIAELGITITNPVPEIALCDTEHAKIRSRLADSGVKPSAFVLVVHPSAKLINQWPIASYAVLFRTLLQCFDLHIVLTGASADRPALETLVAIAPEKILSLAGEISLLEVVALLCRADIFLGADTGPMHMLNSTGTPAVLLFGPTKPERFAPIDGPRTVLRSTWCCTEGLHEICLLRPHGTVSFCMESISVENVFSALQPLLAKAPRVGSA